MLYVIYINKYDVLVLLDLLVVAHEFERVTGHPFTAWIDGIRVKDTYKPVKVE